jgi:hypothetical protein
VAKIAQAFEYRPQRLGTRLALGLQRKGLRRPGRTELTPRAFAAASAAFVRSPILLLCRD